VPVASGARLVAELPALLEAHVELTSRDVANALQKFLAEEISGEDLGMWADALNERLQRGVGVPSRDADLVVEVVQQLAIVHGLAGSITTAQAAEYLRRLGEIAA
jgi:hypothetical protein